MMADLIMLIGLPGVGKSTFYKKKLHEVDDSGNYPVLVSTDDYIEKKAEEIGLTYNQAFSRFIKDATNNVDLIVEQAIKSHRNVVWDQTNLTRKSRMKKLNLFPSTEYCKIGYVFNLTPPEELFDRMQKLRPEKIISLDVIQDMYQKYQAPTFDEGFDCIFPAKNIQF